jgi:uncharacterized iron-regulated membrane protein
MRQSDLYRSVWRWHFFAGLIVLPVLAWMAITGALYLYHKEIEAGLYPKLVRTEGHGRPLSPGRLIERVEADTGTQVVQFSRPASDPENWRVKLAGTNGSEQLAFVRADTGAIVGTSVPGGPTDIIKQLHSLSVGGVIGNLLVEIVAGWAIILVLTGFYLWWPRGGERALSLAGRVTERRFWRNLHASTGFIAGAVILFLAVTGMPWTTFWGGRFHALVAASDTGRPAPRSVGKRAEHHDAHLPWSLQGSAPPAGSHGRDIGIDRAVASARHAGLAAPWTVDLPTEGRPTYRFAVDAERTSEVRMLHLDAASGAILQDISFTDFGPGAKAFEWGIYTHQGQQYGEVNRLVMLAGCIAVLLLTLSAPILWWKRRGPHGLSPPPRAVDPTRGRGAMALLLTVGALFPLTGLSMIVALLAARLTRGV